MGKETGGIAPEKITTNENGLKEYDITTEDWREYQWHDPSQGRAGVYSYRINRPKALYLRPGGTTHRVADHDGVVHCVPAVGFLGCVLRWKNIDTSTPVNF